MLIEKLRCEYLSAQLSAALAVNVPPEEDGQRCFPHPPCRSKLIMLPSLFPTLQIVSNC